ncbi:S41 family peptidase [soil metagenome]
MRASTISNFMKKTKSVILFVLFIVFFQPAFAQDKVVSDVELYRKTISNKHKNPFTKTSKELFNLRLDTLISEIAMLNKEQVIVRLLKINASIEDEHTIMFPNADFYLPFQFKLFDDGIGITVTDSLHTKYLLYKVLSIDDTPITEITSLLKTIIKQDNPSYSKYFEGVYLNNTSILLGLGIIKSSQEVKFKLVSPQGDTLKTTVSAINKQVITNWNYAEPYNKLLAYSNLNNYWFHYNESNKILYFNFRNCAESKSESFVAFNKRLFQIINEKNPARLILDLRFNGGGNSSILLPFLSTIKKSYLNSDNSFFVLIGPKVMSSSLMNAIELKRTTNAKFVGEATGGNINHFGEIKSFELPHLSMRVTYSTKYWENWKTMEGSLKPDILTSNSFSDFINAIDKAIEKISE